MSSQKYKDLEQKLKDAEQYGKEVDADLFETRKRLSNAERILESFGYRRCDIAACNCGSYHSIHSNYLGEKDNFKA